MRKPSQSADVVTLAPRVAVRRTPGYRAMCAAERGMGA